MSFSSTISPETACETLRIGCEIQVLDRCADGVQGLGRRLFFAQLRMQLIELPDLAVGSPNLVAAPGVA